MKLVKYLLCLFCFVHASNAYTQNNNFSAITFRFNNVAGDKELKLYDTKYINAAGDTFSINILQYFITNIRFIKEDGSVYIVPQNNSYFFVQEGDSASKYCTINIPAATYKAINFIVGIDSLKSISGIDERKGVLDPSLTDMYWGWNSGYIFFKMEGFSSSAPEDAAGLHKFRYHIGGFGGYQSKTINNIKTIYLNLPQTLQITNNNTSAIEINVDVLKLFNGNTQISIAKNNAVMFDAFSTRLANNFEGMFSIGEIKN